MARVQETGNSEGAIGLAEAWLSAQREEGAPLYNESVTQDMHMIIARAHCDSADRSLQSHRVEQAFESLRSAQGLLATHPAATQLSGAPRDRPFHPTISTALQISHRPLPVVQGPSRVFWMRSWSST